MSKSPTPKVIYRPPDPFVLDKLARAVCQRCVDDGHPEFSPHEVWRGLAQFLKCVAHMQVKHLNKTNPIYKGKTHAHSPA